MTLPAYVPTTGKESGESIMNAMQAEGVRLSYAYRYTFKAGFGITEEDEDTDATFDEGVKYADYLRIVQECKTLDDLKGQRTVIYQQLSDDKRGKEIVAKAVRKRAEELQR